MYQRESPATTGDTRDALRLWAHLFGGERGLLHIFVGTRTEDATELTDVGSANFAYPEAAKSAAEWALEKSREGKEVYYCAHLLTKPQRRKENAAEVRALWGELDGAKPPNGDLRPTAVVESSPDHYHVYLRLSDAIPPKIAERLNRALAHEIEADPSGFDLSQVLRVPGTVNHKYPEHPIVRLVELDGSRDYSARALEERLASPASEDGDAEDLPDEATDESEPPVRLSPYHRRRWRGEIVEHKENGKIDRSLSLVQMARMLARAGATQRTILEALQERDRSLGWNKYTDRGFKAKPYRDLARDAALNAEIPPSNGTESDSGDSPFKAIKHLKESRGNTPPPGPFPIDALPEGCRQLVREGSQAIGCPPDFLAAPMLAALGSAIGVSHEIEIIRGWTEAPSLWVAIVGHPGARKTPPIREAKRPVAGYQAKLNKRHREAKKRHDKDDHIDPPRKEYCFVDDVTTEGLISALDKSPRGLIQFKDELLGLIRGLDQYKGGKGSDRQFYLSGWSGEAYAYQRKGDEEDVLLPRPFLSVVGSIQTDLLSEISDGREDGLADRFLYILPDRVRSRVSGQEQRGISEDAQKAYASLYMSLRDLGFDGVDEYGHPKSRKVKPSADAKTLLLSQIDGLRDEAELPGFPHRLTWVWPKLEAYLARLALILCLCRTVNLRRAGQRGSLQIGGEDVLRAGVILEHLKRHLRRVYGRLYKLDPKDRVIEDVARFLTDQGGSWAGGTAKDFLQALPSEVKPARPAELGKILKDRRDRIGDISYQTKHERVLKDDGSPTTVQIVRIELHPPETL